LAEKGKLGVLLLQYQAGFHYNAENLDGLEKTLRSFYDYPKVLELRHRSWSEHRGDISRLLQEYRMSEVLIDEPKFKTSIRQADETIGDVLYFRAHGRNAKKWWHATESWKRYDYLYSREEIQEHAQNIKIAAGKPGIKAIHGLYNNHARANAAANTVMLSQELGVKLKGMPGEAMVSRFPAMVQAPR